MPSPIPASRCWFFHCKKTDDPRKPHQWHLRTKFICWTYWPSPEDPNTFVMWGYLQFVSARRLGTMLNHYSSDCKWTPATHNPGVYEKVLSKSKHLFGSPLPLVRTKRPTLFKETASKDTANQLSERVERDYAAADIRPYFNKLL